VGVGEDVRVAESDELVVKLGVPEGVGTASAMERVSIELPLIFPLTTVPEKVTVPDPAAGAIHDAVTVVFKALSTCVTMLYVLQPSCMTFASSTWSAGV